MSRRTSGILAVLAIATLAACSGKKAPNVDPAIVDAIKARQANFREMGAASKNIDDTLKAGGALSPPITMAAAQIKSFAEQQKYWFPPGSGPETGVDTAAKPEIWQQAQQFQERQQALVDAATKLTQVASEEQRQAFAEQFRVVGRACKDCHDTFRAPED
jgi:cytochrome c556